MGGMLNSMHGVCVVRLSKRIIKAKLINRVDLVCHFRSALDELEGMCAAALANRFIQIQKQLHFVQCNHH
jgi:hypothetical protein